MSISQFFSPVRSVNGEIGDVEVTAAKLQLAEFAGKTPDGLPISAATRTALARKASLVYNLTDLRNQDIVGNSVYFLTEPDREGFWYYDNTDLESEDNSGTVVVSFTGKRYKRFNFGTIFSSWFEQTNEGFQKFINASQNKTGIINKSITLTSTVILRSGTLEQYSGVLVTTTATTGFTATDIELRLNNIVWKASNADTSILLNVITSRIFFFNVELKDWYDIGLKVFRSTLFSQVLRLTGFNVTSDSRKCLVIEELTDSFINDLYVTNAGNYAMELNLSSNNFFSNIYLKGALKVIGGNSNSFTNLSASQAVPTILPPTIFDNAGGLRFINCRIGTRVDFSNQITEVVVFQTCEFALLYTGPHRERFVCANTTFAGLPCSRRGQINITSVSGQTEYQFPSEIANTPRYINLQPVFGNPVRNFTVSSFQNNIVLILDTPINQNGTILSFYLDTSI